MLEQLFAGPLNSDLRRRQSTDYLSPLSTQNLGTERPRLSHNHSATASGSPMRERFGALRRRDSTGISSKSQNIRLCKTHVESPDLKNPLL